MWGAGASFGTARAGKPENSLGGQPWDRGGQATLTGWGQPPNQPPFPPGLQGVHRHTEEAQEKSLRPSPPGMPFKLPPSWASPPDWVNKLRRVRAWAARSPEIPHCATMKRILLEGAEALSTFRNPLTLHETRQAARAHVQLAPPRSEGAARPSGAEELAWPAVQSAVGPPCHSQGQGHREGAPGGLPGCSIGSVPAGASSPLLLSEPQSMQSLQITGVPEPQSCNTTCGLEGVRKGLWLGRGGGALGSLTGVFERVNIPEGPGTELDLANIWSQ